MGETAGFGFGDAILSKTMAFFQYQTD